MQAFSPYKINFGQARTLIFIRDLRIEGNLQPQRPHSSLGFRQPAPQAILPNPFGPPYASLQAAQQGT